MTAHPDDILHVMLDGLSRLRAAVDSARVAPWEDYTSEPDDDPKASAAGYRPLIDEAIVTVNEWLSSSTHRAPER